MSVIDSVGTKTAAAQLQAAAPTGTVRFSNGEMTLANVAPNGGGAAYSTASLSAGAHTIIATPLPTDPLRPAPTLSTRMLILFGWILAACAAVALQRRQRGH